MSTFDSQHTMPVSTESSDELLRCALSALPALSPPQDQLDDVLRALTAKREAAIAQQAKLQPRTAQPRTTKQSYKTHLFVAIAASLMIGVTALLLRTPQPEVNVVHTLPSTPISPIISAASSEIAQLIAVSQHLEAGLRDLGESSASFSQLYGRKQAELSLATLDTQLAEVMASNSQPAINLQRALWRERVAVLSAVENGDYREALFIVD